MLDQESLYYLVKFWRNRAEQAEAVNASHPEIAGPSEGSAPAAIAHVHANGGGGALVPIVSKSADEPDYRGELETARRTISKLRRELRGAHAEVRWLEAKLAAAERQADGAPRSREDARFLAVKREFARRYHPSTNPSEGLGSRLGQKAREAIFKDFWPMFETSDDSFERSSAA